MEAEKRGESGVGGAAAEGLAVDAGDEVDAVAGVRPGGGAGYGRRRGVKARGEAGLTVDRRADLADGVVV